MCGSHTRAAVLLSGSGATVGPGLSGPGSHRSRLLSHSGFLILSLASVFENLDASDVMETPAFPTVMKLLEVGLLCPQLPFWWGAPEVWADRPLTPDSHNPTQAPPLSQKPLPSVCCRCLRAGAEWGSAKQSSGMASLALTNVPSLSPHPLLLVDGPVSASSPSALSSPYTPHSDPNLPIRPALPWALTPQGFSRACAILGDWNVSPGSIPLAFLVVSQAKCSLSLKEGQQALSEGLPLQWGHGSAPCHPR